MEERVTVSVKDFPNRELWIKFRAECLIRKLKAGEALKEAIELWFKYNKR